MARRARVAAQQGASVVIGDVLAAEGEENCGPPLRPMGGRCVFVQTDVSQEEDCERLMAAAVEHYGRLDALIACAPASCGAHFRM